MNIMLLALAGFVFYAPLDEAGAAMRSAEPAQAAETVSTDNGSAASGAAPHRLGEVHARTIECIAHVDLFIAASSSSGQVAGPSWQVRDWWDARSLAIDAAVREPALESARLRASRLADSDPEAAEAAQGNCIHEAIAGGAL